ncbi:Rieske (2Fe-2S) protein [Elongatibacter sediminis]|uniref:Non-heme iron oxygenase ferredoxin subunit n=1 Tax=Elongatibacter sediminis TaxID=3119006 RepID=A0AAW9R660_9GAMM
MPDECTETDRFVAVAAETEVPEKGLACFDVEGVGIVLCRFRDQVFALENQCSHALASFDEGRLRGNRIMCPLHGATFDIRDGSCTGAPASRPIRSFPVRVRNGLIEIGLPTGH